jgi:hypothetical protein
MGVSGNGAISSLVIFWMQGRGQTQGWREGRKKEQGRE